MSTGPVGDGTGIRRIHRRPSSRIKFPVFRPFEEVNFVIAGPDKGGVHIIRYPVEAFSDELGVAGVGGVPGQPPVLLPAEHVGLPVGPGERGIQIRWKPQLCQRLID